MVSKSKFIFSWLFVMTTACFGDAVYYSTNRVTEMAPEKSISEIWINGRVRATGPAFDRWEQLSSNCYVWVSGAKLDNLPGDLWVGDQCFNIYSATKKRYERSYQNDQLNVEFVDLDRDGFKDLLISGLVRHKVCGWFKKDRYESVVFVYIFDQLNQQFFLRYKRASFDVEYEKIDKPEKQVERVRPSKSSLSD